MSGSITEVVSMAATPKVERVAHLHSSDDDHLPQAGCIAQCGYRWPKDATSGFQEEMPSNACPTCRVSDEMVPPVVCTVPDA